MLICCVDGLKGFQEAIEAVFPHAWVQTCIVHLIRQSLRFVPDKHRRAVAKELKPIYTAVDADAAAEALTAFEATWGERYPMIGKTWRDTWEHVIPFLAFPTDVRRVVYTTDEKVKGAAGPGTRNWGDGSVAVRARRASDGLLSRRFSAGRLFLGVRDCPAWRGGLAAPVSRFQRALGFGAGAGVPGPKSGAWGWKPRRAGLPFDGLRAASPVAAPAPAFVFAGFACQFATSWR